MPWMSMETRPDPALARCAREGCYATWEDHWEDKDEDGAVIRVCPDGFGEFVTETDEDRRAARATAMGL